MKQAHSNVAIAIRQFEPKDRQAVIGIFREFIAELALESWRDAFTAYVQKAINEELMKIEHYYPVRNGAFWVADLCGAVIGMVGIEKAGPKTAELRRMAVKKSCRCVGIGSSLLKHVEGYCRDQGYERITLTTAELQIAAARLYEKHGYQLMRKSKDVTASHKNVGAGMAYLHYEKRLVTVAAHAR